MNQTIVQRLKDRYDQARAAWASFAFDSEIGVFTPKVLDQKLGQDMMELMQ